jgi:hypothetical protein
MTLLARTKNVMAYRTHTIGSWSPTTPTIFGPALFLQHVFTMEREVGGALLVSMRKYPTDSQHTLLVSQTIQSKTIRTQQAHGQQTTADLESEYVQACQTTKTSAVDAPY